MLTKQHYRSRAVFLRVSDEVLLSKNPVPFHFYEQPVQQQEQTHFSLTKVHIVFVYRNIFLGKDHVLLDAVSRSHVG
jgi:hypothetical protein